MRLIDADSINYHEHTECMGHGDFETVRTVTDKEIAEMPTVDAELVRHGKWIPIPEYENKRCSVCRTVFSDFTLGYYCPKCGAKMDLKGE